MYQHLLSLIEKPQVFSVCTRSELWTTPYIASQMLGFHLDGSHDIASRNQHFIHHAVAFMSRVFDLKEGRSIIDFGCGPGLYTQGFARTGAYVTGIDFSPNSHNHAEKAARQEGLVIDYEEADYLTYEADRAYDAATLIYCDYGAIGPGDRKRLLATIYESLKPGGKLFLDADTLVRFRTFEESSTIDHITGPSFFTENDHIEICQHFLYEEDKVQLEHLTFIEEDTTWHIYNWMQCYSKESLAVELEAAGFRVLNYYGSLAGDPYDEQGEVMAVLCEKY